VWWYVKLYHAPGVDDATTDQLLLECVKPLIGEGFAQGHIDRFFFLRYFDEGGHHLRLRLHVCGHDAERRTEARLSELLLTQPSPIRPLHATYEPEVDKYGGPDGVGVAERHFSASSQLALECIGRTVNRRAVRMLVAACTFDRLLELLAIHGTRRTTLLTSYRDYWNAVHTQLTGERQPLPSVAGGLADWWRKLKDGDASARALAAEVLGPGFPAWDRSAVDNIGQLAALSEQSRLTTEPELILCNLAHTFHNRLGLSVRDEVIVAVLMLSKP